MAFVTIFIPDVGQLFGGKLRHAFCFFGVIPAFYSVPELAINYNFIYLQINPPSGHYSLLLAAIETNKLDVVKLLVTAGMDPNKYSNKIKILPLGLAAKKNHLAIAEYLLSVKADLHFQDEAISCSPLHDAAFSGSYDVFKCFLLHNADIDLITKGGKSVGDCAKGHPSCVKVFNAAKGFRNAIAEFENGNVFLASKSLSGAFLNDLNFSYSFLINMAIAANLRGQDLAYDESYYHPKLLRIAIKYIKTFINSLPPNFSKVHFPDGYNELILYLTGYDCDSKYFDRSELVFESTKDKMKTLRWFAKATNLFEETQGKMKEKELINGKSEDEMQQREKEKCVEKSIIELLRSLDSPILGTRNQNLNNDPLPILNTEQEETSQITVSQY